MNKKAAVLYDLNTIDSIQWPDHEEGNYHKRCLTPLIKNGMRHYVDNILTQTMAIKIDDIIMPITVNETEYENSFVCSNYGHYIRYSLESLPGLISNRVLRKSLELFMHGQGKIFKLGLINKVVFVNNWPYSTTLYPEMSENHIQAIKECLQQRFPDHAIAFRTVNPKINSTIYQGLKNQGFKLVASRLVYFTNTKNDEIYQTRILKSDQKLLRETDYQIVEEHEISHEEIPHLVSLYQNIYLDKYSRLNPQLNSHFIELALEHKILHLKGLKKNGKIEGVIGFFCRNGVMSCPFFGYDVTQEKKGLYRLLSTLLTLEARKRGMIFHQGSGAGFYKKVRRAQVEIEYTAVDVNHLPLSRKLPWSLLKGVYNGIGVPFMKKHL